MDKSVELAGIAQRLVDHVRQLDSCIVAYSGGVDSAVVAKAAVLALGDRAVAVTGISDSLAAGELEAAQRIAVAIGIRHVAVRTEEIDQPAYLRNSPDRCFHCKTELYGKLHTLAEREGVAFVLNGANADDAADFRPGTRAGTNFAVRSPLAELGLTKAVVRSLAQHWEIDAWDKPATPCLSSRVAYGVSISPEKLARIDAAEQLLRSFGLTTVRVRLHENDLARVEAPIDQLARLCEGAVRTQIVERLKSLGFKFVTIDLEGFRSGSFQQLVSPDELLRFSQPQQQQQ